VGTASVQKEQARQDDGYREDGKRKLGRRESHLLGREGKGFGGRGTEEGAQE
jgi:hypothetical protein